MSDDLEVRLRDELQEMARRVQPANDSWTSIHRRATSRARTRHGVRAVAVAAAVIVVAATAVVQPWRTEDPAIVTSAAWSVQDLHVRDRILVGPSPASGTSPRTSLVGDGGSVWFTRIGSSQIHQLDPVSTSVRSVADAPLSLTHLVASPDAMWAATDRFGEVYRLDRRTEEITRVSLQVAGVDHAVSGELAYLDRAVWVPAVGGRLLRVDVETATVEANDVGVDIRALTAGEGGLWGVGEDGTVIRFDPRRRQVAGRAELGEGRFRIDHGEGAVWVLDMTRAELVALTPDLATSERIPVGPDPRDVAVGAGAVWVTDRFEGSLLVIDPSTGEHRTALPVGGSPGDLVVAGDEIWFNDPDAGTLVSVALR